MSHETEILFNEPGIQYQGVNDESGSTGAYPVQGLIVGRFRRGRLDKPMIIHRDNIRAILGHDPKNPYYTAVLDILGQGVPFIHVLRMIDGDYEGVPPRPPVNVPSPPLNEGRLEEDDVQGSAWSLITFDNMGAVNPSYSRNNPDLGVVNVTTHAHFVGQTIQQLQSGAYSIVGKPNTGVPLQLTSRTDFYAVVKDDGANPDTPVLSGNINFDSPISVLFDKNVHAVALTGGSFNQIGSTYIEVYDRLGNVMGSALNKQTDIETFGFSTGSEANIAGFSFYVNDFENAGFAMDNLRFR